MKFSKKLCYLVMSDVIIIIISTIVMVFWESIWRYVALKDRELAEVLDITTVSLIFILAVFFFIVIIGLALCNRYNIKKCTAILGIIDANVVFISLFIVIWWIKERKSPGLAEKLNMTSGFIVMGLSVIALLIIIGFEVYNKSKRINEGKDEQ